jgi:glycosyltransferase involved in cell wall biosynthesis
MPGDRLLVSIIVPTYNEALDIGPTMDALAALTYSPLEIVVVDDASTDNTLDIVRGYQDRIPDLRILPQTVNRGVAAARNVALREVRGEVVVILNADVLLTPDFVEQIVPYYQRDEADYLVINSRVTNLETIYARYVQARHVYEQRTIPLDQIHWCEGFSCCTEAARAVGGFPEEFPGASGEDAVFTEWLVERGYRRALNFDITVPHVAPPTLIEVWKQRRGRGRGGAYRLYAYEKRPIQWGSVARSLAGTWLLAGLLLPALVYAWRIKRYSRYGLRDWPGLAWAHTLDLIAVAYGYWKGCREIAARAAAQASTASSAS